MGFTTTQFKAIHWYMEDNPGLRLQLSTPPKVYFKDKQNKVLSKHISELTDAYFQWNEEDKKQRARDRRQNKV